MPLRVFLVEDSKVIRENLTAALEELSPVVVVGFAEDEVAANQWLAEKPDALDLLVVDIFVKRGSGLGVLRAAASLASVTKVVLSNYATDDMRVRCLALGANRVFDKSNELEAFMDYCTALDRGNAQ